MTSDSLTVTSSDLMEFAFFDNRSLSGSSLRDVYFYFYPDYDVSSEQFVIVNNVKSDLDFFLVKQESASLSTSLGLIEEGTYTPTVSVSGFSTNLRQNLTKNLYDPDGWVPVNGGVGGNFSGSIGNMDEIKRKKESFTKKEFDPTDKDDPTKCIPQVYDVIITVTDSKGDSYVLNGSKYSD